MRASVKVTGEAESVRADVRLVFLSLGCLVPSQTVVRALNWVNRIGTVSGAHIIHTLVCIHCSVVELCATRGRGTTAVHLRPGRVTQLDYYFTAATHWRQVHLISESRP